MVRVKRGDFNQIYLGEEDPWSIGEADSDRYDLYKSLILQCAKKRDSVLDIGCGMGPFLARFKEDFHSHYGIEISSEAIRKGKERFPFINFTCASATKLYQQLPWEGKTFDLIICSDVIAYFKEKDKKTLLKWISDHSHDETIIFIAAYSPGGKYLTYSELKELLTPHFAVMKEQCLETEHALFLTRKKQRLASITLDYETWQPIPPGKEINWEKDIFTPTKRFLEACEGVPLTFMVEMGEYFYLKKHLPPIALQMEEQWKEIIRQGHDIQLHLHPSWLPDYGAKEENGEWHWDHSIDNPHDFPGDLKGLIRKCKETLETLLKPIKPSYQVVAFRSGGYRVQPFQRLYDALVENGIFCDSSVYQGGVDPNRGVNFSYGYSEHQPYFANRFDPQLKAPPSETGIVELPVFTYKRGSRWFIDNEDSKHFAMHLIQFLKQRMHSRRSTERRRLTNRIKGKCGALYSKAKKRLSKLNTILPKKLSYFISFYKPETLVENDYFVMIGHTKAKHHFDHIKKNLDLLQKKYHIQFTSLTDLTQKAKAELELSIRKNSEEEAHYQVKREYNTVMSDERNENQSFLLQKMVPWDTATVLDLGCGAGTWSRKIADDYPWIQSVVGIDFGEDFIEKAKSTFGNNTVSFQVEDFSNMSFGDGSFECVYADNTLEHAYDVTKTLKEVYRVLSDGGILVAAIPSDGRNPKCICDNHTWKTVSHEVKMRLEDVGFKDINIREVDTYSSLQMPPYPPANDSMIYLTARKWESSPQTRLHRAIAAMNWVYNALDPEKPHIEGATPLEIVHHGYGWCAAYAAVLQDLLRLEGYEAHQFTMHAEDHERGRGKKRNETHESVAMKIDGKEYTFDPMCNHFYPYSLKELLKDPQLATSPKAIDERHKERGYHLYHGPYWYSRVTSYSFTATNSTHKNPWFSSTS